MYAIAYFKDRPARKAKAHLVSLNTRETVCGSENKGGLLRFTSKIGFRKRLSEKFKNMDKDCVCGNCLKKVS